jgi:ATP-dependent helicase/nuclease subunit A
MRVRVAGAGTGKTTSLVRRYLVLIGEGVPLRRIAGVTYTRASAAELRQRVAEGVRAMLDEGSYLGGVERLDPRHRHRFEEAAREGGGATVTTIHGFMMNALRLVAPSLGLDPDFSMIGEWEAHALMAEEVHGLGYLAEVPGHEGVAALVRDAGEEAPERVAALFAQRSLTADLRPAGPASAALWALFEAAYDRYRARLGPRRLAPSEVEREALRLVGAPALVARVSARYPVVLVDEFQDVNPLQGAVFEQLERAGARVEVVGDPKQSIYAFRHADVGVFRRAAAAARAAGTLEAPLVETRRHAVVVARFLNHVTLELARRDLGFGVLEAPAVTPVGEQAARQGAVECLWWRDEDAPIATVRRAEAAGLARRLSAWHHDHAVPYGDMAVLARTRGALAGALAALEAEGVPAVLRQGRGFFERGEVRDLYHAVRVALDPSGTSLAAWLRGPFAALPPAEIEAVVRSDDPIAALEGRHAAVAATWRAVRERVLTLAPVMALARLLRDPIARGSPFVASLDARARDNVDALLATVAADRPSDAQRLLDRLDLLALDTQAGDVPQSGEGVQLLTLHAAKGLEWPLVAVFDAGGAPVGRREEVLVEPPTGLLVVAGDPDFALAARARRAAAEAETYRQLYVALSRARDVLIVTGSQGRSPPSTWLRACNLSGVGPAGDGAVAAGLGIARAVEERPPPRPAPSPQGRAAAPPSGAAWTDARFARSRYPLVVSPSWVKVEGARLPPPGTTRPPAAARAPAEEGEPWRADGDVALPGLGAALGTLVHDAIARDWRPDEPDVRRVLAAQEVLWPFPGERRAALVEEALELLGRYWAMLGDGRLPALAARDDDHAELPFAFPDGDGGRVWQGVIDRVYRVGGSWYLDDYKTDRMLDPGRYDVAMAAYVEALAAARGIRPAARLVDLRAGRVLPLDDASLAALWRSLQLAGGSA